MSRSEAVRQEALERDGFRCQITGKASPKVGGEALLEVDHVKELGMGGSDERDVVENVITLHTPIHRMKTEKRFFIEKWDRDAGVLEIGDETHHIITHNPDKLKKLFGVSELWFYRKELAAELEPIEARIQGLHRIDGQVAADLYRLWKDDAYTVLDPEAVSFKQYTESRGWDTRRAMQLVSLYRRAQELEMVWPESKTATDFRHELRNAGKIKARAFYYVVMDKNLSDFLNAGMKIVRTDNPDALVNSLEWGEVAARVGKWIGLQAKDGILLDRDGREVHYETIEEAASDK